MKLADLKILASQIHETSKDQIPEKKKLILVILGRLIVGIVVLKDKVLGGILHRMLGADHE